MAKIVDLGLAGRQNPIFGTTHQNIAEELTRQNWREKAVVRVNDRGAMYIWVDADTAEPGSPVRYYIDSIWDDNTPGTYASDFPTLEQALKYANGQDGSYLASETHPASRAKYPGNGSPETVVFTLPQPRDTTGGGGNE